MRPATERSALFAVILCSACLLTAPATEAAPFYDHYDFGTFGLQEAWTFNGTINGTTYMNQVGDQLSQRFTVLDTATVDRAWQRVVSATNATFTVGIMADNGSGNPTGTYLLRDDLVGPATASHVNPGSVNALQSNFSGAVTLSPGVYHLVTTVDAVGTAFEFRGSIASNIRNYDRAMDTNMATLTKDVAGSWTLRVPDPFLGVGDSAGPNPDIMQQVYNTVQATSLETAGGSATARGQRFVITEGEVPANAVILVDKLTLPSLSTRGSPDDPLVIRLRKSDSSILATMIVLPSEATGAAVTRTFDPVFINQGDTYLLTFEFANAPEFPGFDGGTTAQAYRLPSLSTQIPNGGRAGWGGDSGINAFAAIIQSGASNNWSTYADNSLTSQDMRFTLFGQVFIPEPASAALLASLGLIARRRSGRR